jgi:hypothetical protein
LFVSCLCVTSRLSGQYLLLGRVFCLAFVMTAVIVVL